MKSLIIISLALLTFGTFAENTAEIEQFFSTDKNQKILKQFVESGKVEKIKGQYRSVCDKAEIKPDGCDCLVKAINQIPDKYILFEFISQYRDFKKLEVAKQKGEEEYQVLKTEISKKTSVLDSAREECGIK